MRSSDQLVVPMTGQSAKPVLPTVEDLIGDILSTDQNVPFVVDVPSPERCHLPFLITGFREPSDAN